MHVVVKARQPRVYRASFVFLSSFADAPISSCLLPDTAESRGFAGRPKRDSTAEIQTGGDESTSDGFSYNISNRVISNDLG